MDGVIQNVIPLRRKAVSYADEREANLVCMRSELLAVQAQLECSAAVATRHGCHAVAAAWSDSAGLIRDAVGRAS